MLIRIAVPMTRRLERAAAAGAVSIDSAPVSRSACQDMYNR